MSTFVNSECTFRADVDRPRARGFAQSFATTLFECLFTALLEIPIRGQLHLP